VKRVLKGDFRIDRGGDRLYLVKQEAERIIQMCIAVPRCFKDGDRVRVTVERIGSTTKIGT